MIELSRVTKTYGDLTAVDAVSLRVSEGEIYALLGLNGAGKTTLIRMLLGMIRPTTGSVRVLGAAVTAGERSAWSRVGYLVEAPAAYPELTVRENLEVIARLRRITRPAREVREVIGRLALTAYADRPARSLSMGNLQRLGLAKALMHHPDLLVLDEPVNGLDPAGVVEIRTLLAGLARDHGVTVLLSSHLLAEVTRLATRVGIIHHGRLRHELDAHDLHGHLRRSLTVTTHDDEAARAVLRSAGYSPTRTAPITLPDRHAIDHPERIATLLVRSGHPPTALGVHEEDLETYFLRMVGADDA